MEESSRSPSLIHPEDDNDSLLANSDYLTRKEVLKRRARRLTRLANCYRDHYWALMEEVSRKHREFYWIYGKSPYREEGDEIVERDNGNIVAANGNGNIVNGGSNGNNVENRSEKLGVEYGGSFNWCSHDGCGSKAMALTRYCLMHIMCDTKQVLYKRCKYPQLRLSPSKDDGRLGSLLCNRPILNSTNPPLCQRHVADTKKHVSQALKKGGASAALSNKLGSKFHLVINEYVHQIQSRRRDIARRRNMGKIAVENGRP